MTARPDPRILIVEDSDDDAALLQAQLRRIAPAAFFARVDSPAELRSAFENHDWDLVICDHSMPQLDSSAALRVMKESGRDIPFIIYSGLLEERVALAAISEGAQDFVDKRDTARLLPVVERELRNSQVRRAKREAESSVVHLSHFDSLTRLPNRQFLERTMEVEIAGMAPDAGAGALIVLDVDRFMRFNDSLGYAAGDQLMRQIGARLVAATGVEACVARLGLDEFAIFLSDLHDAEGEARAVAERIESAFDETPFSVQEETVYVGFSMGIALSPVHGNDPSTLLKNAEGAMAHAKRPGAPKIQLYHTRINQRAGQRLKLENALRGAVAHEELIVHYQPIVDLDTGRILATEALLRWNHPELGVISPDRFIPLAEEMGLIREMGEWVLREACAQTHAWRRAGHDVKIAVNASADQFLSADIAARIPLALRDSGLDPEALELEITETVAMKNPATAVALFRSLKSHGVQIAIDDFGTGFSSLSYLKRFPIDILKLDRSFVRDLPGNEEDIAIVRMVAALGRSLGLALHAEGVETARQRHLLGALGYHRAQGHHFSAPVDAACVPALLAARNTPAIAADVASAHPAGAKMVYA